MRRSALELRDGGSGAVAACRAECGDRRSMELCRLETCGTNNAGRNGVSDAGGDGARTDCRYRFFVAMYQERRLYTTRRHGTSRLLRRGTGRNVDRRALSVGLDRAGFRRQQLAYCLVRCTWQAERRSPFGRTAACAIAGSDVRADSNAFRPSRLGRGREASEGVSGEVCRLGCSGAHPRRASARPRRGNDGLSATFVQRRTRCCNCRGICRGALYGCRGV